MSTIQSLIRPLGFITASNANLVYTNATCPQWLSYTATASGHTIQLPLMNLYNSCLAGQTLINIRVSGTQPVNILDADSSVIATMYPGDFASITPQTNSTTSGNLFVQPLVQPVNSTLQNAYDNGNGVIAINTNSKPFALSQDESTPLNPYGVYLSALRNSANSPTLSWFQFFEANDSSSSMVQYGAVSALVLDNTAGNVAGQMSIGAATASQSGEVLPYFQADGQAEVANIYFNTRIINSLDDSSARDLDFIALNDSSNEVIYSQLESIINDSTTSAECGSLQLSAVNDGILTPYIVIDGLDDLVSLTASEIDINTNLLYLSNPGQVFYLIQSLTTGSSNEASIKLDRGDQANGFARIWFQTGGSNIWTFGLRNATNSLSFRDEQNAVSTLVITPGSGTSSLVACAGDHQSAGNTIVNTAGKTVKVKSGANSCFNSVTLSGASTTVSTTAAATGDFIWLQHSTIGGTPGVLAYTIANGSGFTITSTQGVLDTSVVNWWITKAA